MNFRRRQRILNAGKSPSRMAMERVYKKSILNGGVTVDFSANVENIRELSRKLGHDVFKDATLVYVPSSYGENRNYTQSYNIRNLLVDSDIGTTQSKTVTVQSYILSFYGTGTYTLSGAFIGSLTGTGTSNRVSIIFVPSAGTLTLTVSGSITNAQLEVGIYPTLYQKTVTRGDEIFDFIFSRTTSSTLINKLGFIEDSCYNLAQRSEEFDNASWTKSNSAITINTTTAPNGTLTADKLVEDTNNTMHYTRIIRTNNINETLTFSVYAKAAERTWLRMQFSNFINSSESVWFNLSTGVIGSTVHFGSDYTNTSSSIVSVGNGWYRCSITATKGAVNNENNPVIAVVTGDGIGAYVGDGVSGIYIWGAQLTQGSTVRPYLRTTNRLNVPKLDYNISLLEPSLLIEPQRINLILQSQTFDSASWIKQSGVTAVTINSLLAPDNTMTADKVIISTNGSTTLFRIGQSLGLLTNNITYTFSVYIKKAELDYIMLRVGDGVTIFLGITINLNNGTVTEGYTDGTVGPMEFPSSYKVTQKPNGWFFVTFSFLAKGTTPTLYMYQSNTINNTTVSGILNSGTYLWGGQLEAGINETTYIQTTTLSVTRNGDTSYIDLYNNASFNQNNWTLFWEGYLYDGQTTSPSFCLSDSTTASSNTNQIGWYNKITPFYNVSNIRTNFLDRSINNFYNRLAIQYNNGIVSFWINGIEIIQNRPFTSFNYRYLVLNSGGSTFTTNKIALFNKTLSDTECFNITNGPSSVPDGVFISTWNTNNISAGSSLNNQITLPLVANGTYSFSVNWGDGYSDIINAYNQLEATHTYSIAGTYTISITGICLGWKFGNAGDRLKILSVQSWGGLRLTDGQSIFQGCSNLNLSGVTDILYTTGISNFSSAFNGALSNGIVNRIGEWDMSSATTLNSMFQSSIFNSAIGTWNVSNVTSFQYMFNGNNYFNNGGNTNISNWVFKPGISLVGLFYTAGAFNQPIGNWNVSTITSMQQMFYGAIVFNQDIGSWNVSSVTTFNSMFAGARAFNNGGSSSINNWSIKTTGTIDMSAMFGNGGFGSGNVMFNQPIGNWNTVAVTNMNNMFGTNSTFANYVFNQDISNWNTSNVTDMSFMFSCNNATFNSVITNWNVSKVTNFSNMFSGCTGFNNGLASGVSGSIPWTINTVSNVLMTAMFASCVSFNQNISSWNMIKVTSTASMFSGASKFNQPMNSMNFSNCTSFAAMLSGALLFNNGLASGVSGTMQWTINNISPVVMTSLFAGNVAFNQDIGSWDMSRVTLTNLMFVNAFLFNNGGNPSINNWNTSNITSMNSMFCLNAVGGGTIAQFNQPIGAWNVLKVTDFTNMFNIYSNTSHLFNQDISSWNTSAATNMSGMFGSGIGTNSFNQNIGSWNVSNVTNFTNFMVGKSPATLSSTNLDAIYNGWSSRPVKTPITISFGTAKYTSASSAGKAILTGVPNNWTITDGGI